MASQDFPSNVTNTEPTSSHSEELEEVMEESFSSGINEAQVH